MKNIKHFLKRYLIFIIAIILTIVVFIVNFKLGLESIKVIGFSLKEMIMVIPPVFILIGLLDVWIPKETIIKYMGERSGIRGAVLAFIIGSAAAGPLYGAFPVAAIMLKKRVKFSNITIFLGAWSTTKIPMFLFEISALGGKFALTRLVVDIIGIVIISQAIALLFLNKNDVAKIYDNIDKTNL